MSKVRVLTPVVAVEDNTQGARAIDVDRLAAGKLRIGLLDNTKPNAGRMLTSIGELLKEHKLAASTFELDKSDSPGLPSGAGATEAVLARLTQDADLVLTGLGN